MIALPATLLWIARDCCCLFVPCYWFDEERQQQQQRRLDEETGVRTLLFQLPPDWDPLQQYIQAFDRLDMPIEEQEECDESPIYSRPLEVYRPADYKVSRHRIEETLGLLSVAHPGTLSHSELNRSFSLLLQAIRQTEPLCLERERLIRQYEAQRAVHSQHDTTEIQQAQWSLEMARSERQEPAMRIHYYQKSLYYTHRPSEKRALRDEYVNYCTTLIPGCSSSPRRRLAKRSPIDTE